MADPKPFVEITGGFRTPTPDERREANLRLHAIKVARQAVQLAQARLTKLEKACPHTLFVDVEGFPYDERRCFSCDKHLGMI